MVKKEAQTEEPSKGRYGLGVEKALCDVSEVFTERIPTTERGAEPSRGEKAPSGIPPRVPAAAPCRPACAGRVACRCPARGGFEVRTGTNGVKSCFLCRFVIIVLLI